MNAPDQHSAFVIGVSGAPDTRQALRDALEACGATKDGLTLVFCAASHDPNLVARILSEHTGAHGVAVSTEGELSPLGFTLGHIVALHLPFVRAAIEIVTQLSQLSLIPLARLPETLARRLEFQTEDLCPSRHAWVLMADGTTRREPLLTSYFARVAPKLGLVGGSFGDGSYTSPPGTRAWVAHAGRTYSDAAALTLIDSARPFHIFHHTHHDLTEHWVTATSVSEDGYHLHRLNDQPATDVYAKLRGHSQLTLEQTWSHPFGTRFKGRAFPISITDIEGTTLRLGAPIHEGERLCLLTPGPMVPLALESVRHAADALPAPVQGMLMFHCVGRYLDAQAQGVDGPLAQALATYPVAGFNTWSEQFGPMHVNHSITGIAFG